MLRHIAAPRASSKEGPVCSGSTAAAGWTHWRRRSASPAYEQNIREHVRANTYLFADSRSSIKRVGYERMALAVGGCTVRHHSLAATATLLVFPMRQTATRCARRGCGRRRGVRCCRWRLWQGQSCIAHIARRNATHERLGEAREVGVAIHEAVQLLHADLQAQEGHALTAPATPLADFGGPLLLLAVLPVLVNVRIEALGTERARLPVIEVAAGDHRQPLLVPLDDLVLLFPLDVLEVRHEEVGRGAARRAGALVRG
mmetsp:Transcript_43721/g.137300  ORF Transcript_43721/g.137300 Transcript_43721/m.137300 type:complete len:258 (+) Transcript_43721:513-1286(+)